MAIMANVWRVLCQYTVPIFSNFLTYQANFILDVQNLVGENNDFLRKVSRYSEPAYAISILFPVFASLDSRLGFEVLLVSTFTEWSNTLLKWLFAEGRPYWWVAEAKAHIPIRQTDVTCETGPGSPSGHVMGTAALGFVILFYIREWFFDMIPKNRRKSRLTVNYIIWSIYFALILLVSLSRINLAAHFPHQCIEGAALGTFIGKMFIYKGYFLSKTPKMKMLLAALMISIISVAAYGMHWVLGYDAGWSIKLAFKWCERPHSVSVHSTPIYSLVRDCGCLFALGLVSPIKERKFYPVVGATVTTLFFIGAKMLRPMMPSNDPLQFYLFHFLDNMFTSLCLLTVVPYIASLVKLKEKKA